MNEIPSPAVLRDSLRQTAWLAALTLTGWLAGGRWPVLLNNLGISDYGMPYLDSYVVLAALDALRAGADVHAANALDPLFRGHVYSDWWLQLHWLGLTRAQNFFVGTAWVGAFGLTAWFTSRPRRWSETIWLTLILISPPVLLGVRRANIDLVIFVVLAGCGLAASSKFWWRQLIAVALLALATGLKYFPATGALAFLWVRPVRRMPVVLVTALAAVALALASVWTQIDRGRFAVGSGVYTMGAPLLWRDLGWKDADSAIPGVILIVVAGVALALGRVTRGLAEGGEPARRLRAALGCIVLLTCFSAGVNYAYRWVFIVWPAIWLWQQAADPNLPGRQRGVAGFACGLIGLALWVDGLFCVAVNRMSSVTEAQLIHLQYVLRLWTQPLQWLLMGLFAGWLFEAGLTTLREWGSLRHAPRREEAIAEDKPARGN